jgi:multidrug resistance efflux pump
MRRALRGRRDKLKIGRLIMIEVIVIVILAALGVGGYYLWWQGQHYVSTDDAQLSGNLVTVVATAPGKIAGSLPVVGSQVKAGQQILTESVSTTTAATGKTPAVPVVTNLPVNATATGRVAQVSVVDGQIVAPGTPLATIVATTGNQVVANIPETEISNVKVGQFVDVTIDAYPGDTFPGHVTAVVPATQSALSILPSTQASGNYTKVTQRVPVLITFENPNGVRLYTGLSVEIRVHISGS